MCHEIQTSVVHVPVSRLRESSKNALIHADMDFQGRDAWLLEDVQRHGILIPLVILGNFAVSDGHRRLAVAKKLGIDKVPCLVAQTTDEGAIFSSAQLARHLTLFAKCVMHRQRIVQLIERSQAAQHHNLTHSVNPEGRGDCNQVNQDWVQCEEVLGISRRYLIRGVKLLGVLETLSKDSDPAERQKGARIASIFRNRGLKPALRMLDQSDDVGDDNDAEPDVSAWGENDDGEIVVTKKPKARRGRPSNASKAAAAAAIAEPPATVAITARPVQQGNWVADGKALVVQLRRVLRENKAATPETDQALSVVESAIIGGQRKRAA